MKDIMVHDCLSAWCADRDGDEEDEEEDDDDEDFNGEEGVSVSIT